MNTKASFSDGNTISYTETDYPTNVAAYIFLYDGKDEDEDQIRYLFFRSNIPCSLCVHTIISAFFKAFRVVRQSH